MKRKLSLFLFLILIGSLVYYGFFRAEGGENLSNQKTQTDDNYEGKDVDCPSDIEERCLNLSDKYGSNVSYSHDVEFASSNETMRVVTLRNDSKDILLGITNTGSLVKLNEAQ